MDFSTVAQNGEIGAARSGKSAANHRRKRDAYVTRPALAPDEHPQQVRRATQKQAFRVDETPRNVSDRAPKRLQDGLLGPYWWHHGASNRFAELHKNKRFVSTKRPEMSPIGLQSGSKMVSWGHIGGILGPSWGHLRNKGLRGGPKMASGDIKRLHAGPKRPREGLKRPYWGAKRFLLALRWLQKVTRRPQGGAKMFQDATV